MRERCPLAVWAVMPAVSASSDAVWARPSISSDSMDARAGSPIRAATSERAFTVVMPEIYARAREAARVNGSVMAEPLPPYSSADHRQGDRIWFQTSVIPTGAERSEAQWRDLFCCRIH